MIIGGYAVVHHGESRFTEDIDVTLGIDTEYLEWLLDILADNFKMRVENAVDFVAKTNVLPVEDCQNSVQVDLLFSFIDFEREAIERAETVLLDNREIKIISASDLIIYKLLAARARDIEDARSVLQRKANEIDVQYLDRELTKMSKLLNRNEIYKKWEILKKEIL